MFKRCLTPTILALPLMLTACGEPEDLRVFNEVGTWSMQRFALDGTNWEPVDQMARDNAFLLRFDPTEGSGVVAAASCGAGGSFSVKASTCRIALESDRSWQCRCFSYLHEQKNIMEWQEFAPGDAPPPVVSETGEDGGEGGDTEGDPSDTIAVQKDPEINGAVLFQPLPYTTPVWTMDGLFNSDGMSSRYQFLQKSDTVFEESGCAEACGF